MKVFLQPTGSKAPEDLIMINLDSIPNANDHVLVSGYKGQPNGRFQVLQVQHIATVIAGIPASKVVLIVNEVK